MLLGIDGGGTQTTLAVADAAGREVLRRQGGAGLVDANRPESTAEMLGQLAREALRAAGSSAPAAALCAGLAGVGNRVERDAVQSALARSGVADRVRVLSDGEAALQGAFGDGPGILLIAGTGSVAWARADDGRTERCGGWGMVVGDEGSGYAIARAGLRAALQATDGRGEPTLLLPRLLEAVGLEEPEAVPPWIARAAKSEVAALAAHVVRAAEEGDVVAGRIVREAARALADHVRALLARLGPWRATPAVALHGGVARRAVFAGRVREALAEARCGCELRDPAADAVAGALQLARELAAQPFGAPAP